MSPLYYFVLGLVVLFGFIKFKIFSSKYKAAMNALLAKHTFETLDPVDQARVVEQTKTILLAGGFPDAEGRMASFTEKEKYGFYALAMSELNIFPALADYDWYYVKNPFVALIKADNEIQAARRRLIKSEGVDVEI